MNPIKYKVNDRVRIKDNYFQSGKRGKEGTVVSVDVQNLFLSGLVAVKLDSGEQITLTEISIEPVPASDKPVEGSEIARNDIKVGQTVRVSLETVVGSYKQISIKEGIVTRLKSGWGQDTTPVVKPEDSEITLSFGTSKEVYTLIKDAEEVDEIADTLKELRSGSVVQIEDDGHGKFVLTYVKTNLRDSINQLPMWSENDSRYASTNRSVSETVVRKKIQSLDQIVVKL